jgi:hypothetical protein
VRRAGQIVIESVGELPFLAKLKQVDRHNIELPNHEASCRDFVAIREGYFSAIAGVTLINSGPNVLAKSLYQIRLERFAFKSKRPPPIPDVQISLFRSIVVIIFAQSRHPLVGCKNVPQLHFRHVPDNDATNGWVLIGDSAEFFGGDAKPLEEVFLGNECFDGGFD